ncbi:C4-dicarboxylate ABC transporter substrate-binding protein [Bradyrhizobium sp. KBS0727]|nr:C4-dicarboxylate ABC transporter substrate-binding protein [Bradyrhizobium sp. KBS0725]QDW45340.1 C4-dicarboxylate ABC transporter substrate-binding protein [Bradyrhizobium sp. KBS0727]
MSGLAINSWPRWLRILIVGAATAATIGGGWFVYRYFAKPVVLTVAAGSADGDALALISAISARLATSNSHVRLKVSDSGSSAKAAEMLAAHKVDLAIVRGDTSGLADARSVLLLTHGVVLIMAPSAASADSLGDLRNTTIGVVGGAINQPAVEALKQVYQFDRAKVTFQDVAISDAAGALASGKVHALLVVVPLTEKYLAKVRQFFQQERVKGAAPKLIEIESAGAVVNVAQYYESYDIPKGTLRGAPPVPSDDLTSLRVSYFLVANKSVNADAITDLTQSLVDAKRDLLSQFPILAQAAAPSTDTDALIPIHPGAATYYNGNQQSFLDKYDDKLYYGSLLLGSLISVLVAAWRFARSDSGSESKLQPLYELGNDIRNARSEAELDEIEKRIDHILKAELARNAGGEGADSFEMAALGLAAHRLQYLMSHCRSRLASGPANQAGH